MSLAWFGATRWAFATAIFAGCCLGTISAFCGQTEFLKLAGVPGESTAEGHANEIDLSAWSWGVAAVMGSATPGWSDLLIKKRPDSSSPKLLQAVCSGQRYQDAVLTVLNPAGREFYRIELAGVRVSRCTVDAGSRASPTEQAALSFESMRAQYLSYSSAGSVLQNSAIVWNRLQNTGSLQETNFIIATLSIGVSDTQGQLSWPCAPGQTYEVLMSGDLSGPFEPYGTYNSGQHTTLTVPIPADRSRLFFRIRQQ